MAVTNLMSQVSELVEVITTLTNKLLDNVGMAHDRAMMNAITLHLLDVSGVRSTRNQKELYFRSIPAIATSMVIVMKGITLFLCTIIELILFRGII